MSLAGCRKNYLPTGADYTDHGWTFYEEGSWDDARVWFRESLATDSSYAEGYSGLGWALAKLDSVETAYEIFGMGMAIGDSTEVYPDLLAGRIFAAHALGNYDSAAVIADEFLEFGPGWIFGPDRNLNFRDVYVMLAASAFSAGEYGKSLEMVNALDADFSADVNTAAGLSKLSLKIEELSITYL